MSPQHLSRLGTRGVKLSLLLSLILAVCATALVFTARSGAQEREVVDKIPAHLPVKFKVKNPEKAKDLANDDWLRDIEIEVKNTGTKPIYFLRFSLFFIDVKKDGGGQIGYPLAYGRHQMLDIDERAKPEDVPIMPGETHVFKMPTSYVKGWNWYRTKVEPKPHPKKIGLRFYELNFGDGTGFTGTGGDPIPSRKSSVNQRENPTRAAREWLSPHPSLPVNNVSFLPAAFAPVNFFTEALGSSLPTTTSPQTCCPGTPCQKMKTVLGGNCFCEEGGPPTHVESVFDCNSSAACGTMEMEFIECGVGTADYHTCTNFFRASCGSTFPTPTPTPEESPTPDPSATPEPCP